MKIMPRKRVLLLFALSVLWAGMGCRLLVDLVSPPTPEPTYAPLPENLTPLKFSPEKLPEAQVGQAYNATITIADNSTPISSAWIETGQLPAGLEIEGTKPRNKNSVEISGVPQQPGEYRFIVYVSCFGTMVAGQTGQHEYTIVVK